MNELHEQLSIYNYEKHAEDEKIDDLVRQLEKKLGPGSIKRGTK